MAVISTYTSKEKEFVNRLTLYITDHKSIPFSDLVSLGAEYNLEFVHYTQFYNELPDLWKQGGIPSRASNIFGLANPNTKHARIVFPDSRTEIYYNDLYMIELIFKHELVHVGQMQRLKDGVIYVPPKTVHDSKLYFSDPNEIMAWSKTIVDDFLSMSIHSRSVPKNFEEAIKNIHQGKWYDRIKKSVDEKVWKKYLKNIYNFLQIEFKEKQDLNELKKIIKKTISEVL